MTSPDEVSQMISDCEARESRLSEWERGFIDSISKQVEQGRSLTEKQKQRLVDIWEDATEDG